MLKIIDGTWVINEDDRRLRWEHERQGHPSPRLIEQWVIGDLWPSRATRAYIRRQLDLGQRALIILQQEEFSVVLPREHVPSVPIGVTVTDDDPEGDLLTMTVPALNWLTHSLRARGLTFIRQARQIAEGTPSAFLPPLLIENELIGSKESVRFAYQTGSTHSLRLPFVMDTISAIFAPPRHAKPVQQSAVDRSAAAVLHLRRRGWTADPGRANSA